MHENQAAKTRMKKNVLESVSVRSYGQSSSFYLGNNSLNRNIVM